MDSGIVAIIVAVVVVLLVVGLVAFLLRRRQSAATSEETQRLRAFSPAALDEPALTDFRGRWQATQTRFVDQPKEAVSDADTLIQNVLEQRGYPLGAKDKQLEALPAEHGQVLKEFQQVRHSTASNDSQATTEELRQVMVRYHNLSKTLLN